MGVADSGFAEGGRTREKVDSVFMEMVFSVICPYGDSSYFHTNGVCLEKENLFPCKGSP